MKQFILLSCVFSLFLPVKTSWSFGVFGGGGSNITVGGSTIAKFQRRKIQEDYERASVTSTNQEAIQGESSSPSVSNNSKLVAFQSRATNLATGDSDQDLDVFVRNRKAGETGTELASVSVIGQPGNADSWNPSISGNGRFVAFVSNASDLDPIFLSEVPFTDEQIYLRDRETSETVLISANGASIGDAASSNPVVSNDGAYVYFESMATNLLNETVLGLGLSRQIYRYEVSTGEVAIITKTNVSGFDVAGSGDSFLGANTSEFGLLPFQTAATNLHSDTNGLATDILLWDGSGLTLVSENEFGQQADSASVTPAISHNGQYVVYSSIASNLTTDQVSGDVVHIFKTEVFAGIGVGTTVLVSKDSAGVLANDDSREPAISKTGRYVLFTTGASNLSTFDTNGQDDVYAMDAESDGGDGPVMLASESGVGNGYSKAAVMSSSAMVTFESSSDNFIQGDTNQNPDVYMIPVTEIFEP